MSHRNLNAEVVDISKAEQKYRLHMKF